MLEFIVTLDTREDILKITGPSDLKKKVAVYSIEDMCEVFKQYMLEFCKKVHFGDYRIDKVKNRYYLSKDNLGTRSKWDDISTHSTYFEAYETMCEYKDNICKDCEDK